MGVVAGAGGRLLLWYNKVKPPYNISQAVQELVIKALDNVQDVNAMIQIIVEERKRLEQELPSLPCVVKVYPSDSNSLLVKTVDAKAIYQYLLTQQIVVRDRSKVELCEGCLRITVGTVRENDELLNALRSFIV